MEQLLDSEIKRALRDLRDEEDKGDEGADKVEIKVAKRWSQQM